MTDGASISLETGGPRPQNRMMPTSATAGPMPVERDVAAGEVGVMVGESDVGAPYGVDLTMLKMAGRWCDRSRTATRSS